ncbi:MAG TPA: serine hydrolase domain-containing protein [Methyloceanibacter sp.]|jgi:CubicO group peptidase (beta-lactamase class C family)|nr:serine hydrolase domain-containing protein [Methyloceanibacter sp.]
MKRRVPFLTLFLTAILSLASSGGRAAEPGAIESDLVIAVQGEERHVSLDEALKLLNIPSASLALIDEGRIAFASAYGNDATPDTAYQAASMSKFVAAVGAMRLVEDGTLDLDQDVNATLTSWKVPNNSLDATHKVTLRGLLSMTGGIGVPGFLGYEVEAPLPTIVQILDGVPPANSPPVTVVAVPGGAYHYSGGGYEIAEALMQDATGKAFPQLMQDLVLGPMGMTASNFEQPPSAAFAAKAASGHFGDGKELPGRWHVFPEHAAAGLWSTPTDLAKLLVQLADVWQGLSSIFLRRQTLEEMLTPQNGGPYGLGAAIAGDGASLVLMKRGQNIGYQGYLILFPASGQGLVVMTNSDNGSKLAEALIKRAASAYGWPELPPLAD